jgi:hypothetical protein
MASLYQYAGWLALSMAFEMRNIIRGTQVFERRAGLTFFQDASLLGLRHSGRWDHRGDRTGVEQWSGI